MAIANHQEFLFGGSSQCFLEGPVQVDDTARGIGNSHEIGRRFQDVGEQTGLPLDPLALGDLLRRARFSSASSSSRRLCSVISVTVAPTEMMVPSALVTG